MIAQTTITAARRCITILDREISANTGIHNFDEGLRVVLLAPVVMALSLVILMS